MLHSSIEQQQLTTLAWYAVWKETVRQKQSLPEHWKVSVKAGCTSDRVRVDNSSSCQCLCYVLFSGKHHLKQLDDCKITVTSV